MDRDSAADDAQLDPLRALALAVLDRVEIFATTVIGDGGMITRNGDDIGQTMRAAIDVFIADFAEVAHRVVATLIAVLEAIAAAIDDVATARASRPTSGKSSTGSYQPISVDIDAETRQ